MNILPFLSAAFLLINPVLLAVFRKYEIKLEKLQFWVMVSSGTAWIIAAVFLILNPESHLNPVWDAGVELLPSLAFSMDWVSASLALAVCGALFFSVLRQEHTPRINALLAGLGGVSAIGVFAESAYTLALVWTALETFYLGISYPAGQRGKASRNYLLAMLVRLTTPAALVFISLTKTGSGGNGFLTGLDPAAAPAVIVAGLVGFLGWFLGVTPVGDKQGGDTPPIFKGWIPGTVGLMVILRGGVLLEGSSSAIYLPLLLSVLATLLSIGSLLLDLSSPLWFLGGGLLAAGSASLASPAGGLAWGVVFMLPGSLLWHEKARSHPSLIGLGLAGLGLLPLPYLPAWSGIQAFPGGIASYLLAASCGIFLGSLAIAVLKNLSRSTEKGKPISLMSILASGSLLLSQLLIAFRLGLLGASKGLLSHPVVVWLPLLGILLVLILGNWVPLRHRESALLMIDRGVAWIQMAISRILRSIESLIIFLAGLLEGDGGLIWALLIGMLIITLIGSRGVR